MDKFQVFVDAINNSKYAGSTKKRAVGILTNLRGNCERGLGVNEHFFPTLHFTGSGISYGKDTKRVGVLLSNVLDVTKFNEYINEHTGKQYEISLEIDHEGALMFHLYDVVQLEKSNEEHRQATELFENIDYSDPETFKWVVGVLLARDKKDAELMRLEAEKCELLKDPIRSVMVISKLVERIYSYHSAECRKLGYTSKW